ncbi:unnamed protein product, partial [Meganyctiphanes norvegica]
GGNSNLPGHGQRSTRETRTGSVASGVTVNEDPTSRTSPCNTPNKTIPGRGNMGHYGKWMMMLRQHANKDSKDKAKDAVTTSIIDTLSKISAVSILNVMHNAITLHKRTVGAKQQCTPSQRLRQCRSHCL